MEAENLTDWIEKYLTNKLSTEEIKEFDKKLLEDDAFAEEVQFHQRLQMAIELEGKEQLRKELTLLGNSLSNTEAPQTLNRPIWKRPWIYAAAAAIAFIFFLRFYTNQSVIPDSDDLYTQYIDVPSMRVVRGEVTDSLMQLAYSAYSGGDYLAAKELLTEAVQVDSSQVLAKFYLGITCLKLDEASKALTYFKQIPQAHAYSPHARWYIAMAYLKQHNLEACKNELQYIVRQSRHYKRKEAVELLAILEKFPEV